jgi:hypothetical protein
VSLLPVIPAEGHRGAVVARVPGVVVTPPPTSLLVGLNVGGVGESLGVQGESAPLSAPESQSKAGVGTSFDLPSGGLGECGRPHVEQLGLCEGSRMSSEPECEPGTIPGKKGTVVKKRLSLSLSPGKSALWQPS